MVGIPGKISDLGGKLLDGSWESALVKILDVISLRVELQ
jgi:hypothetical protein